MKGCAKTLLAALLAALLLFPGCSGIKSIREDSVRENLPQIDPEAGTARDFTTTMYYWLSNEPYLVPIRHSVTVGSNETPEDAIVLHAAQRCAAACGKREQRFPRRDGNA